jgi:RNA polymerase sigma-70 factor (ECF subfamily)
MNEFDSHATLSLLHRAHGGDAEAVDALLRHVGGRLTNLAHRMLGQFPRVRRWADTGDVLQNAVLRLLRALRDVRPATPRDFFALASMQLRRELIDLARHFHGPNGIAANHQSLPLEAPEPAAAEEPASLAHWSELHEQIEALPDEEREVVGLLFYQGLSQADASEVLNISVRTVQRRWHAALVKLHRVWNRE